MNAVVGTYERAQLHRARSLIRSAQALCEDFRAQLVEGASFGLSEHEHCERLWHLAIMIRSYREMASAAMRRAHGVTTVCPTCGGAS